MSLCMMPQETQVLFLSSSNTREVSYEGLRNLVGLGMHMLYDVTLYGACVMAGWLSGWVSVSIGLMDKGGDGDGDGGG
jgi:hypothetical protein